MTNAGELAFSPAADRRDPKPTEGRQTERDLPGARVVHTQLFGFLAVAYLVLALAVGGSSLNAPHTDFVELCAIPFLAIAVWRLINLPRSKAIAWPCSLLLGAVAIAVLQLLPTPPWLWTALPGRQTVVDGYEASGLAAPWSPISLTPQATRLAAAALLPPMAMFLAVLTLDARSRRLLAMAALAVAVGSVILGMLQLADGDQSILRLYDFTDTTAAVGFFANRNHQGALLAATLPLAALIGTARSEEKGPPPFFLAALSFAIAAILAVGVAVTKSRAGIILLAPGLAGALAVAFHGGFNAPGRFWRRLPGVSLAAAAALSAILVTGLSFTPLAARFDFGLTQDLRYQLTPVVIDAGLKFSPVGSGLGSFPEIYPMFETSETLTNAFINHAHNDYAEIWLECGWPGVILIAGFVLWWAVSMRRSLARPDRSSSGLALASGVVVGLLLIHSGVDYPLRTSALATFFALACGLMTAPPQAPVASTVMSDRSRDEASRSR